MDTEFRDLTSRCESDSHVAHDGNHDVLFDVKMAVWVDAPLSEWA